MKKNSRTLLQRCTILIDTDITDNDDPIKKKNPREDNLSHLDLALKFDKNHEEIITTLLFKHLYISENKTDFEDEIL